MPTISIGSAAGPENTTSGFDETLTFTVTLSETSLDAVSVSYRLLRSTADADDFNSDITSATNNGRLTFAPGDLTQEITIRSDGESTDEVDEFYIVELFNPSSNANFLGDAPVARATGTLRDDDGSGSNLAIHVSDPQILEGNSGQPEAVFELRLSQPATNAIAFTYTTKDISATAGEDYVATSGTEQFGVNQEVARIRVPLLDDSIEEITEKFALIVTPPAVPALNLDGAVGVATIADDDAGLTPAVSVRSATIIEDQNNGFDTFMRFVVTLSEPTFDAVVVNYRTLTDTADDTDTNSATTSSTNNGTVTFAPGQTSQDVFIRVNGDRTDEFDENIVLELFDVTSNAVLANNALNLRATGVILDNDGTEQNAAIFVSDPVLTEGDNGFQDAVFEVRLSRPLDTRVSFDYTTRDGIAVAGQDYTARSGSLDFEPGETLAIVRVPVRGDLVQEYAETFSLSLTQSLGTPISATEGLTGVATILDNDGLSGGPVVSIEGASERESSLSGFDSFARFNISLSEASLEPVTLNFRLLRDTARDSDFNSGTTSSTNNNTITFDPGETTKSLLFRTNGDSIDERDENYVVELYNLSENADFAGGEQELRATGIMRDDDGLGPNRSIFVSNPVLLENTAGLAEALFEIRLSEPADAPLTLRYKTHDITAQAGEDYTATAGEVDFAVGEDVQYVRVPVAGDDTDELTETFGLIVELPSSPSFGSDGLAGVATIRSDDGDPFPPLTVTSSVADELGSQLLRFTVSLSEPLTSEATVNFATILNNAEDSDLSSASNSSSNTGTLTFAPGELSKDIFVRTRDDSLDERDESIFLRLDEFRVGTTEVALPDGANAVYAVGFILDNDGVGLNRALAALPTRIQETEDAPKTLIVPVFMSRPADTTFEFDVSAVNDGAREGIDFLIVDRMVSFEPGQTEAGLRIQILDDDLIEPNEAFDLLFTPSPGTPFAGAIPAQRVIIVDGTVLPPMPTPGDDDLIGTPGNDTIDMLEGNDRYAGRAGNDLISGGSGNDSVGGQNGNDTINGDAGNDGVFGENGNDLLRGGDGADSLFGGAGNDTVFGDNGRDTVFLGTGADVFNDNAQGGLAGSDTVNAGAGDDVINGGNGDDVFAGEAGNDRIFGRLGNDLIFGGSEFDTIDAGDGNDTVFGGNGRDLVFLGNGNDLFNDNAQGGVLGRDTVFAGNGDDLIEGGNGDDNFNGEAGNDVIFARFGDDRLTGGDGFDTMYAAEGNDTVFGGNGRDLVFLGDGADLFVDNGQGGTLGQDTVYGGLGNDTIEGGAGADIFFGNDGNDVINARLGNDSVYGGANSDLIDTGDGNDLAFGGLGRDRVSLGAGNDRYVDTNQAGAQGQDTIAGGLGADSFVFGTAMSADVITDFQLGVDTLELAVALAGGRSTAQIASDGTVTANGVLLNFGGGNTLLLEGLTSTTNLGDDIVLV